MRSRIRTDRRATFRHAAGIRSVPAASRVRRLAIPAAAAPALKADRPVGNAITRGGNAITRVGNAITHLCKRFPHDGNEFSDDGNGFSVLGNEIPHDGNEFPVLGNRFPHDGNEFPVEGKTARRNRERFRRNLMPFWRI